MVVLTKTFELIQEGCAYNRFWDDYSGRGMFGKTCFGFVGSYDEVLDCLESVIMSGEDLEGEDIDGEIMDNIHDLHALLTEQLVAENYCRDTMGLDYITYFPDIQVADEIEED